MEIVPVTTIGKLIEAFQENDMKKFLIYADFVAQRYEKAGMTHSAKIIRSRIDGSYKNQPKVVLD